MKQFFPTGASGSLARFTARYTAAQELRPALPHGWACDGQAKLLRLPSCSAPATHYPAPSANALASICEGVPPQAPRELPVPRGLWWGKENGCLLSSISNLFCIHLHAGHRPIHITDPICELQIICQSKLVSVCARLSVWREIQDSRLCNINYM